MYLTEILDRRREQLRREMSAEPFREILERIDRQNFPEKTFKKALTQPGLSVIAEVKKASPSKGLIQPDFDPVKTAAAYEKSGAAAISCLTEEHYFQGSAKYLEDITGTVNIPVLRKDFIIHDYQVYHAKAMGASAVLLIAAILSDDRFAELYGSARTLGMDVLAEAHNEDEVTRLVKLGADIIGINNRDLKTFKVDIENTKRLKQLIPPGIITVCESGIKTREDMQKAEKWGVDAVLIGETLMRSGVEGIPRCMKTLKGED
ncbi:MAG: indole-3-glycerol phosphate synthase TrpC [Ruminococcus sp.]|nr:indole-3-glycerol phosphate synthase TrpC [Ruminococcus sp.]